jgi:type IV pilus assembly protein PilY1
MLVLGASKDGWFRTLSNSKERAVSKPVVMGGNVFTPTFIPNDDVCGSGGESYLYGLYYETGTAFYEPAFDQGTETVTIEDVEKEKVLDWTSLGTGISASLGVHVGTEEGATGFVQQSTGAIQAEGLNPALGVKSGLRSWREK